QFLGQFTYGLPETQREAMKTARYISGVGCNATASILALLPLVKAGLLAPDCPIVVDVKTGSSEAVASVKPLTPPPRERPSLRAHHPEKSHAGRASAPTGPRHTAEVIQELGLNNVHLSMTAVDMVRGALAAAHVFVKPGVAEKDLWKAYRAAYGAEPFVRIVK